MSKAISIRFDSSMLARIKKLAKSVSTQVKELAKIGTGLCEYWSTLKETQLP